jgi:hypothetical protein
MAKSQSVDDEFDAIANRTIEEAGRVEASIPEYQRGLKAIIHLCEMAIKASEHMDGEED